MNSEQKFPNSAKAIIVGLTIAFGISVFYNFQNGCKNTGTVSTDSPQDQIDFPYFVSDQYNKDNPGLDSIKDNTSIIKKSKADSCIDAYKKHPSRLTIYGGQTLRGYVINIPNLKKLLDQNPEEIFLEFGVKPELMNANQNKQYFTMIISGYDKSNYILRDGTDELFYEYIRPCPPNCPR